MRVPSYLVRLGIGSLAVFGPATVAAAGGWPKPHGPAARVVPGLPVVSVPVATAYVPTATVALPPVAATAYTLHAPVVTSANAAPMVVASAAAYAPVAVPAPAPVIAAAPAPQAAATPQAALAPASPTAQAVAAAAGFRLSPVLQPAFQREIRQAYARLGPADAPSARIRRFRAEARSIFANYVSDDGVISPQEQAYVDQSVDQVVAEGSAALASRPPGFAQGQTPPTPQAQEPVARSLLPLAAPTPAAPVAVPVFFLPVATPRHIKHGWK